MVPCDAAVVSSLSEVTSRIYSNIITIKVKSTEWLCEQAILTQKNDKAAEISDIRGLFLSWTILCHIFQGNPC